MDAALIGGGAAAQGAAAPDPLLDLFLRLVVLPSPSRHERAVADLVIAELDAVGLEVAEDDAGVVLGGDCGNLTVRVAGRGEGAAIVIAAHLDTVAVDGEIVPVIDNGVVRSAGDTILGADDKTAVAALVSLLCELAAARPPAGDVIGLFTVAEEIGVQGSPLCDVAALGAAAGFVFDTSGPVGVVVVGSPSQKTLEFRFHGVAAHAGIAPESGRSAVVAAAGAVASMPLGRIDELTTANVGRLEGGTATNIVAEHCLVTAEARSHDPRRLATQLAAMIAAAQASATLTGVDLETEVHDTYPGYAVGDDSLPVRLAFDALRAAGIEPRPALTGGGSDANVFNALGLPSVNLSVGMEDVHSSREYLPVSRLHEVRRVMGALVAAAAATSAPITR